MRIIPAHEKYRHKAGRYYVHGMAIYATHRTSQPPDYRTYSPEVTSSRSNLPVHRSSTRRCVSSRADLLIIKDNSPTVKRIFSVFYKNFQNFLAVDICHFSWDKCGNDPPFSLGRAQRKPSRGASLAAARQFTSQAVHSPKERHFAQNQHRRRLICLKRGVPTGGIG